MTAPIELSSRAAYTPDQPISFFMAQAVENPHLISLAAGLVDSESLPAEEIHAALDEMLRQPAFARASLQYGTTPGYAPLREKLLARLATLDGVTPQELSLSV